MERFLRGLLLDLNRRCRALRGILASRTHHADLSAYVQMVGGFLDGLEHRIRALLGDPDLGAPAVMVNQLQEYKRLAEATFMVEAYPVSLLDRYADVDHRWFAFSRRVAAEIRYPHEPPLVSAGSREYYWTYSPFRIIALPTCEHTSLLGLPDFFHELGHNLLFQQPGGTFTHVFVQDLERYIAAGKRRVDSERRAPAYKDLLDWVHEAWRDRWLEEFSADMIAAYLAGPAYAWQHFRLCARSRDLFRPGPRESEHHPSDEARMRGILGTLELLGLARNTEAVRPQWEQYLSLSGEQAPLDYELCYPGELIASLGRAVVTACQTRGLRPYSDNPLPSPTVVGILNEAWERFLADPNAYHSWEAIQLALMGLQA